jgi:transcriptional antiterminator NusG
MSDEDHITGNEKVNSGEDGDVENKPEHPDDGKQQSPKEPDMLKPGSGETPDQQVTVTGGEEPAEESPAEEPVEEEQAPGSAEEPVEEDQIADSGKEPAAEEQGAGETDQSEEETEEPAAGEVEQDTGGEEVETRGAGHKWYVLHTYSGFELKVKASIEERIAIEQLEDDVSEVLIPVEEVMEVRKGKKQTSDKKFFPGYILVRMNMTEEARYIIKSTPKVTDFVGMGNTPTAVPNEVVQNIKSQIEEGQKRPKPKVLFSKGEKVRVIDGPFSNFSGIVEEVNPDKATLKVLVSIFGRSTPIELEFVQVENL